MRLSIILSAVLGAAVAACAGPPPESPAADPPAAERHETRQSVVAAEHTEIPYANDTHGAIQVRSASPNPHDFFEVLKDGQRALLGNPRLLDGIVELPPGTYEVVVNRTSRTVTLETGNQVVLSTGDLRVDGGPDGAYWYPMLDGDRKLASNPPVVNGRCALFPGSYRVFVHVSVGVPDTDLGVAEVVAGETTRLQHTAAPSH